MIRLKYDKHLSALLNRYRRQGFKIVDWTVSQDSDGTWYYFGQLESIRNVPYTFKEGEV